MLEDVEDVEDVEVGVVGNENENGKWKMENGKRNSCQKFFFFFSLFLLFFLFFLQSFSI